ncbi:hypothetical protein BWX39_02255 [Prevotella intermedia ATCC 25611 = DSM 20706]|uniref:hypothetical protein n=1 Tax=Prevotella intermedia TaxID=28131 RepID=UPI0004243DEB|nr:hypothetical protein [Prevotella intermedia]APW31567.1 hypothetical protein BWX39_02255 [Prevotella intermedia ATCC 25611 = DSM 20706]SUB96079.1 Uncharacterised protein [Prevotella intermedia]
MNKKEYIQPKAEVVIVNGDTLMDGEWWSVQVNLGEEIEDDDIGAKEGSFDDDWGFSGFNSWDN